MRKKVDFRLGGILLLSATYISVGNASGFSRASRFLQTADQEIAPIEFNEKLPCSPCILNGWIYCLDGKDHQHVDDGQYAPDGICCESLSDCAPLDDPSWTCSNSYADQLLALRMCPFKHEVCGPQSEFVFKQAGSRLNTDLTFYPSDICFFTMRTECGVPAFQPEGDAMDSISIMTIEYDDGEVDSSPTTVIEGTQQYTIPIPKKSETFDGKGNNRAPTESQLLYSKTNTNGSVTYFYQNGTFFTYESPKVVTFLDDDEKDYMIIYPNGTNVTYKLNGESYTEVFDSLGAVVRTDNPAGGRLLQEETLATTWGTVFFYADGRIKEILPNGAVYWNYKFYDPKQNPNRQDASKVNNTVHLRVRYNTEDGSFIMYWADLVGDIEVQEPIYMNSTVAGFEIWEDYFHEMTEDPTADDALTHPDWEIVEEATFDTYNYVNDTIRKYYKLSGSATRTQIAVSKAYEDIFANGTIQCVYNNGTIAILRLDEEDPTKEIIVSYVKRPTSFFEEKLYEDYEDVAINTIDINADTVLQDGAAAPNIDFTGFEWIQYLNNTVRLYYPEPTKFDTRYYNQTSIKYEEFFFNGQDKYRVVFNNGTIALYNYGFISGNSGARYAHSESTAASATNHHADPLSPRPIGARGGLNSGSVSRSDAITFGDKETGSQFAGYERPPFSLAKDFYEFTYPDGRSGRVYEVEYDDTNSKWKYRYQNLTAPLNSKSFTFDNNTRMLYNESADLTVVYGCQACQTSASFSDGNGGSLDYTVKWEKRVFINQSEACFVSQQWLSSDSTKKTIAKTNPNYLIGMHCASSHCNDIKDSWGASGANCVWGQHKYNTWTVLPKDLTKTGAQQTTTAHAKAFAAGDNVTPINSYILEFAEFKQQTLTNDPLYKSADIYYKNDTTFLFPNDLPATASAYDRDTAISYTIRYQDQSTKTFYRNKTVANFDRKGKFLSYDKEPTSFAVFYPIVRYADKSYWIDFTVTNSSRRFIQEPATSQNTTFQIATQMIFSDVFSNGTVRTVYRNGTIAWFKFNGFNYVFDRYERSPTSFFVDCTRTTGILWDATNGYRPADNDAARTLFNEGRWWQNCTNGTRFQWGPNVANDASAFVKATQYIFDDVHLNGTRFRYFRNGSRGEYRFNGFNVVFVKWVIAPTAYFETCTNNIYRTTQTDAQWPWAAGTSWVNCSVGAGSWNSTLWYKEITETDSEIKSVRIEINTGVKFETYYPNGSMRRVFRNGTIAIYQYNGLFYSFNRFEKAPTSMYIDCDNYQFGWLINPSDYDNSPLPSDDSLLPAKFAPLITASNAQGGASAISTWTQVRQQVAQGYKSLFSSCEECRSYISTQKSSNSLSPAAKGPYLCELSQMAPRAYKCYYEPGSGGNEVGYYTNSLENPSSYSSTTGDNVCDQASTTTITGSTNKKFTLGCQYKCMQAGYWLNHGDLTFDFESDPTQVFAQCSTMAKYSSDSAISATTGSSTFCNCLQKVDPLVNAEAKQKQRWRNCTNGTTLLEYQEYSTGASASGTADEQDLYNKQILKDEIFLNGTRLRTFVNGTVAFLRLDLTLDTVVVQTPYLFSKWIDCTPADTTGVCAPITSGGTSRFLDEFALKTPYISNPSSTFNRIRIFTNGTIWWYKNEYVLSGNTGTQILCGTSASVQFWDFIGATTTSCLELVATQFAWFESQPDFKNRTVYYTNGTVTIETWSYSAGTGQLNRTIAKNITQSPTGAFISHTYTVRPSNPATGSPWTYSNEISFNRDYNTQTNKSSFFYFKAPEQYTGWAGFTSEQKERIRATGEAYLEYKAFSVSGNEACAGFSTVFSLYGEGYSACVRITYRNGTQSNFRFKTSTSEWEFAESRSPPPFHWYYYEETYTYQVNTTSTVGGVTTWSLGAEQSKTMKGYELVANVPAQKAWENKYKTSTRFISDQIEKSWFDGSGQNDFNYEKLLIQTYRRIDIVPNVTTGTGPVTHTLTVNYTNGTICQYTGSVSPRNFRSCSVQPKSYFSWYTQNNYADGTREMIYSDFYTIVRGPPLPNPAPANAATNFEYQRIRNTGLLQSIEYRLNGTRIATYRNDSQAEFQNGKFTRWIVAPASTWIWCETDSTPADYIDYSCTNSTTIRVSKQPLFPAPSAGVSYTFEQQFKLATFFNYMEIFGNGTTNTYYLNGSSAVFNTTGFVRWISPPDDIYVGKIFENETQVIFTNGTVKLISPATDDPTELALGIDNQYVYPNGTQLITFRNGSVGLFNLTGLEMWITPPTEFLVTFEKIQIDDGFTYKYSNGTIRTEYRAVDPSKDSMFYQKTSAAAFNQYPNGTTIVFYRNGTIANFNQSGFINYTQAPDSYFYENSDGSYEYHFLRDVDEWFTKGMILKFQPEPTEEWTQAQIATGEEYSGLYPNGDLNVKYRNGTLAYFTYDFKTETRKFIKYIVPPTSFFVGYEEEEFEGGIIRTFDNKTQRIIYDPLTSENTRIENATAAFWQDTYPNGTMKRYFYNGTIAVYFKSQLIGYDVKPAYMYIDYPRIDFDDESYELKFFNGTRRWYAPPLTASSTVKENKTGLAYTDCFGDGVCNFYYRNSTRAVYVDGQFIRIENVNTTTVPPTPPPPTVTPTPTNPSETVSVYVNKTGPKRQVYDPNQGGVKKYKETKQSDDTIAAKSGPSEPLCKGRNQMIIMADTRIDSSIYLRRRDLQMRVTDDVTARTASLSVTAATFTGALQLIAYSAAVLMTAFAFIF